ncbi:hypothetical protein LCGC14_0475190 [marine sediment metagenome]|uniref:Uncharacterized protein n=1 Tax=marine sediment metagenome TaxID=412755 RepID=A0A0F9UXS8_9ZZZZ
MLKKTIYALISAAIIMFIFAMPSGCTVVKQADGRFKVGVTPETHQTISDAGEAATGTLGLLSTLFPALIPIAAAAGVGTATWKKMRTTVTKNREPLEMLVKILEKIKKNDKTTWTKIKKEIRNENPGIPIKTTIEELVNEFEHQHKLATLS